MKILLSPSQSAYFHQQGEILFQNSGIDFQKILHIQDTLSMQRDLWRKDPFLKKLIMHMLAPIAFELTKQPRLRLGCDQWVIEPYKEGYIQDYFCFQKLAIVFTVSFDAEGKTLLKAIHPSHLNEKIPSNSYFVAFVFEKGRLINNPKDPFTISTRNLGYVYGDELVQEHHPLISRK